jgi:opacity protein-like surface antigen
MRCHFRWLCWFTLMTARVSAEPSELPPEVGYNYNEHETGKVTGKNGADRALGTSLSALYQNPANMAAARVYHLGALVEVWPEASRQSYGVAAVDSVGSSSHLAGGLGATWTRQDPDGLDRTATDLRFALAFPFSPQFFAGAGGRFLWLSQDGDGPLGPSYASGGLDNEQILKSFTLDLGATLKPAAGLSIGVVGTNLNSSDHGFQPLSFGGGIGYGGSSFALEGDVVADFVTWGETTLRAMLGLELLFADHVAVRGGYRYDQGAESHSGALGLGYIDKAFSLDAGVRRVLSGDAATAVVLSFSYHVESTGLTPTPSDTF